MVLQAISQAQAGIAQSPFGQLLISPKNVYNAQAKLVEHAGFKNVGDFFQDPGDKPLPPPPQPPDPKVVIEQMRLAADAQKFQATSQQEQQIEQLKAAAKLQETQAQLELQQANDERDAQRELMKAQYQQQLDMLTLENQRLIAKANNQTAIVTARIAHPGALPEGLDIDPVTGDVFEKPDEITPLREALIAMMAQANAPKTIVKDESGRAVGVQHGEQFRPIQRDETGRVIGLQ